MKVRDIMASPAVTAPPEFSVLDAARLMKERNIGSLVVHDGRSPVGILTERDLVTKALADGLDPKGTRVRELMSSPLLTIPADADVLDAARTMSRHHVRRLPVVNGVSLVGIVSERDILEVSPDLIEVTRTLAPPLQEEPSEEPFLSKCEMCSCLTEGLRTAEGLLLCEDCWDEQREQLLEH